MANLEWPPRGKRKLKVDACANGGGCAPRLPKVERKHKTKVPDPKSLSPRLNQNVRDLENNPGDVLISKNPSDSYSESQMAKGRAAENALRNSKLEFQKRKKK